MSFSNLIIDAFGSTGADLRIEYNTFCVPYHPDTAWPLQLPDVKFESNTVLFLHFQDFITVKDNRIVELELVEQQYGPNANQVVVVHWSHAMHRYYQGPLNLLEFDFHEYEIIKNLVPRWEEWKHIVAQPKTQNWQCLNGRYCRHRRTVVDVLKDWNDGVLSYGSQLPLSEWAYSTYSITENEDNFIRLANVYGSCAVNIVTETQYDQAPGLITEKTLFSMLAEQIPVVIGYPGIVADCQELGFDMFTDVVDVSYDTLPNDIRAKQAILLNQDLIQGRIDLSPYQQRLRAQREFLLDDYPTMMELRFLRDCRQLISKLNF